jgi:hypothetical protein
LGFEIFLSSTASRPALRSHIASYSIDSQGFSLMVKWLRHEAHLHLVMLPLLPYTSLIKHRKNFIFLTTFWVNVAENQKCMTTFRERFPH